MNEEIMISEQETPELDIDAAVRILSACIAQREAQQRLHKQTVEAEEAARFRKHRGVVRRRFQRLHKACLIVTGALGCLAAQSFLAGAKWYCVGFIAGMLLTWGLGQLCESKSR